MQPGLFSKSTWRIDTKEKVIDTLLCARAKYAISQPLPITFVQVILSEKNVLGGQPKEWPDLERGLNLSYTFRVCLV